jgi:hypothetical protein
MPVNDEDRRASACRSMGLSRELQQPCTREKREKKKEVRKKEVRERSIDPHSTTNHDAKEP